MNKLFITLLSNHINDTTYISFAHSSEMAKASLLASGFWCVDENRMWFRKWDSGNDITDSYIMRAELCVADKYELVIKAIDNGKVRTFNKRFLSRQDVIEYVKSRIHNELWNKFSISIASVTELYPRIAQEKMPDWLQTALTT